MDFLEGFEPDLTGIEPVNEYQEYEGGYLDTDTGEFFENESELEFESEFEEYDKEQNDYNFYDAEEAEILHQEIGEIEIEIENEMMLDLDNPDEQEIVDYKV